MLLFLQLDVEIAFGLLVAHVGGVVCRCFGFCCCLVLLLLLVVVVLCVVLFVLFAAACC